MELTHALLVEHFKRTLHDETFKCRSKKTLLDLFLNREILVVHLINYIDFNSLLHHVNNFSRSNYD